MNSMMHNRSEGAMADISGLSNIKRTLFEKFMNSRPQDGASTTRSITPRPSRETAPLSFSQEQVWLHAQMAGGDIPLYNESIAVHREGSLDVQVLETCLAEIVRRHEVWRTTFDVVNGQPVQVIGPPSGHFQLPFRDLSSLAVEEREQ